MFFYIFSLDYDSPLVIQSTDTVIITTQDGYMTWSLLSIIVSSCEIDVSYFPFDNQICTLAFSVLKYKDAEVNFTLAKGDANRFATSNTSEWTYMGLQCSKSLFYQINTSQYTWIRCDLHLKRQPAFYIYNVIVPCVMLLFIGSLAFCLPACSGERVSMSVTVFLALVIFLMAIMDIIPPGANMPLLG